MRRITLRSLMRLIELSGELDIGRTTGSDAQYGAWYGFTWQSSYVYGDTPREVVAEMLSEAAHNEWRAQPIVQLERLQPYLKRRAQRRAQARNTHHKPNTQGDSK